MVSKRLISNSLRTLMHRALVIKCSTRASVHVRISYCTESLIDRLIFHFDHRRKYLSKEYIKYKDTILLYDDESTMFCKKLTIFL